MAVVVLKRRSFSEGAAFLVVKSRFVKIWRRNFGLSSWVRSGNALNCAFDFLNSRANSSSLSARAV
jgi:hypothetical protein